MRAIQKWRSVQNVIVTTPGSTNQRISRQTLYIETGYSKLVILQINPEVDMIYQNTDLATFSPRF